MKTEKNITTLLRPLASAMVVAGLAAISLAGCDTANGKTAEAPAAGGPPISAAAVVEKNITETQEFSGRLEAIERVEIRSRVSGFITAVNFKPGSEVKKGDVLFQIDARPYQAELSRAEAAANSARAKADLAKLELARAEKLLADKAIAQREYDEKASGLKELDANARAATAQAEAARLNVAYTQVVSPINGRVSKAEITLGNLVDASAVLTSVVSLEKIYASFDGDEDTYLRVGTAATKGKPVTVKVGLANETGKPALLINDRAVGTDQNRKFVFVVGADSKAEYRPVTLGPQIDGLRVVRDGLKPGEKIVVNGLQRVRPGAPVTAEIVKMDFDPLAPAPAKPEAKKEEKVAAAADKASGTAKQ
jgi:multidrug efflux system membrane fusion protein